MRCTYGPLPVFSAGGPGVPDQVIEGATGGIFSVELNGPALPIYDFSDQPIPFITSSPTGQAQWRVDDQLVGWVRIGGVSVRVSSNDAGDLLQKTADAVAAAQQAAAAAAQSLQDLRNYIGTGPGAGGGGLPSGTTLDNIPNGVDRYAVSAVEKNKIGTVPASFVSVAGPGSAATAMRSDRTFTAADVGAVRNMEGVPVIWGRTAAQGPPTAAEGALDGHYCFLDA